MPYLVLLIAAFLVFAGGAVVFAAAGAALLSAAALRKRRAAWAALAALLLSAPPALFTFSFLSTLAWPGRFEPVAAEQVAGRYRLEGAAASIELAADGGFSRSAEGWRALPASGGWSWHPAADWRHADEAGQVHLHGDGRVLLVLHADRSGAVSVERVAFSDGARREGDYLQLVRSE